MAIKLLPKSEIARLKAVEQRQAVDEGVKLAKRVDRLREVSADTEASFKKFRDESIAKINEEINKKAQEKAQLVKEVTTLEETRAKLLEPLTQEWDRVNQASSDVNRRTEEANVIEHKLKDREGEADLKERKATSLLHRAATKDELATSNLNDAAAANNKAQLALASAEKIKDRAIEASDKISKELTHRDLLASSRERSVTIREEAVAKSEVFIQQEKARLRDREATLERAFTRIKKSNG